jgi:beta-xylosidase
MSFVVAKIDHIAIFPEDFQGWKEFVTYAVSINLSYFSGAFIRRSLAAVHDKNSSIGYIAEILTRLMADQMSGSDQQPAKDKIDANIRMIKTIRTVTIATASTVGSVYTGISNLIN